METSESGETAPLSTHQTLPWPARGIFANVAPLGDFLELETEIRRLHAAGELEDAATAGIKGYGPQILGFLIGALGDYEAAGEVFAQFCADLWAGVERFDWRCSFRTWSYVLARNAMSRYLRDPWHWRAEALKTPILRQLEARVRTSTITALRDRRDRWTDIRAQLTPDERALLILRVDKELAWSEVARVMLEGATHEEGEATPAPLEDAAIAQEAALLRKRFQRLKQRLRKMVGQSGEAK